MQNIEDIYKQHCNTVYKYLFYLTHNEEISEDLTQETFAIAVKQINKFRGDCKVSVWLCQIAKHLWYKELKKNKQTCVSLHELSEVLPSFETTEEVVCKTEDKLQFFKDMQILDELSKQVVYLRVTGNLNFIEIAEVLGKTPNWARVTFHRAKQKIKEVNDNGKKDRM
jgi:RNA polymerase sigma factor (sigma-70 family)